MILQPVLIPILSILLSVICWAQEPLSIVIYETSPGINFSRNSDGGSSCRIGLTRAVPAEILGQEGEMIHVRFPQPLSGCFWDQLTGRDMKEGWIPKSQITYAANELEVLQPPNAAALKKNITEPCPEQTNLPEQNLSDIGDLVSHIHEEQSGIKSESDNDTYLACYPQSEKGQESYLQYKPAIDKVTEIFHANLGLGDIAINKVLFTCLLRRESGFDPDAKSGTGAVGLGQHTSINIEHIGNRLAEKNSWEKKLWDLFFTEMSQTSKGRRLMDACPQTVGGRKPTFNSQADAKCPLNSMAASAIYNLQVQQALRRTSTLKGNNWKRPLEATEIAWQDEMTYQLAIGAAYNLGDGAASRAVDDLELDGWLNSIRNRSDNPSKRTEVASHIDALTNCMQKDNWKPMHPGDTPQCQLPITPKTAPAPRVRLWK